MKEWRNYESLLFIKFHDNKIDYERYVFLVDKLAEWHDKFYGGNDNE